MRRQPHHRPQRPHHVAGLAAAACLLAACGGGGGGTGSPAASPGPAPVSITVSGSVSNSSGAPVMDAIVSLGTTNGTPVVTQTDMNGSYALPVDISTVNTGTTVVVTVAKEGYKSCTGTVNSANGAVTGCDTLPLALPDELHPAPADAVLTRLGDGEVTGGATNSALQIAPPSGLSKTIGMVWSSGLDPAAYQTFTVNVNIRGMQAFSCADKITVLQGASAGSATEIQVFSAATGTLADSDALGAFSPYALQLPASALSASGGNVYVKLEAGLCVDGTPADPADDFEFVGLYGKFS